MSYQINKKCHEAFQLVPHKSLYGIKQELERLNLETPMHKKVWHSNDKYRCVVYRCNKKYNEKKLYKLIEENSAHAQNQDEYNK